MLIDAVANAKRGVAAVVDDDLFRVVGIHQDLHIDPGRAWLQNNVRQKDIITRVLRDDIAAGDGCGLDDGS